MEPVQLRQEPPELVSAFIEEFNAELRRIAADSEAEGAQARRSLADIERKLAGIVRAIEDGADSPALKERLAVLERDKEAAAARLAQAKPAQPLRLHPNLPELYRRKVEGLAAALSDASAAPEAGDIIRSLIDRIVLTPVEKQLSVELFGGLVILAGFATSGEHKRGNVGSVGEPALLSVVAGARNHRRFPIPIPV